MTLLVLLCLIPISVCHAEFRALLDSFNKEAYEWVGISQDTLDTALEYCHAHVPSVTLRASKMIYSASSPHSRISTTT